MAHCCKCGEEYPTARLQLGYRTCLDCGSPAPVRTVIPFHKSNYMLVTKRDELVINPKLVGMA
jgi:RNA polymerase-binding transcription factor DksA